MWWGCGYCPTPPPLKRLKCLPQGLGHASLRFFRPVQPAHELKDEDLPLLLEKVVAFLCEIELSLEVQEVRFRGCDVQLRHTCLTLYRAGRLGRFTLGPVVLFQKFVAYTVELFLREDGQRVPSEFERCFYRAVLVLSLV